MIRSLNGNSYRGYRGWIITAIFVMVASFIVTASYYGNKTLSAVQVFVEGEGIWHKAQKEAVICLLMYSKYQDRRHYESFQKHQKTLEGYRQGREAMLLEEPDLEAAYAAFSKAGHDNEDIKLAFWLFDNFRHVPNTQDILDLWGEKDSQVQGLDQLATELDQLIRSDNLSGNLQREYSQKIFNSNEELSRKGDVFRTQLEQASDWIHNLIIGVTVSCGLILALIGSMVTIFLFRRMNRLNEELTDSRTKLNEVLRHSRDVIYQHNLKTGVYEYMSPYVETLLGYSAKEVKDKGLIFLQNRIHPDDRNKLKLELNQIKEEDFNSRFDKEIEFRIKDKKGKYIWVNNQRTLLTDEQGRPYAIVGCVRNVTEGKKRQLQIDKSLQQKQLLLEEIHHRVKNNLAIVSSLIELQKSESPEETRDIFSDVQSRIKAVALIHEKLYQSKTLSDINMKEYIAELAEAISRTYSSRLNQITLSTDLDDINLEVTDAIPLGLILNELLNNAYKHAFANLPQGTLRIQLKHQNGRAVLSVADDGAGLPEDFDLNNTQSLGMTLVKTFSRQIEANVNVMQNGWTTFMVDFNLSEV